MNSFIWIDVHTPEQAVAQLSTERGGPARLKAGGVDLLDRLKEGLESPGRLINLRRPDGKGGPLSDIGELKAATLPEGVTRLLPTAEAGAAPVARDCVRLGALATLSQIASHPDVARTLPALSEAAHGVATPQIRQVATLGGNLLQRPRCWYYRSHDFNCRKKGGDDCFALDGENELHAIFDNKKCAAVHPSGTATALVALDAIVEVVGKKGTRYQRASALMLSPSQPGGDVTRENRIEADEVLTAVYVPVPGPGERNIYQKVKQKQSFDWPLAEVAIAVRMGGSLVSSARIVLGGVAPIPWRAKAAEAALLKVSRADAASLRPVGQAATEGATPLSGNKYKVALCQGLVQQAAFSVLTAGGR